LGEAKEVEDMSFRAARRRDRRTRRQIRPRLFWYMPIRFFQTLGLGYRWLIEDGDQVRAETVGQSIDD